MNKSLIICGGPGIGKTQLSKTLAELVNEDQFMRFETQRYTKTARDNFHKRDDINFEKLRLIIIESTWSKQSILAWKKAIRNLPHIKFIFTCQGYLDRNEFDFRFFHVIQLADVY